MFESTEVRREWLLTVLLFCSTESTSTSSGPSERSSASSFNRFTDSPAVEEALREGCLACIHHILSSIRSELAGASPDPSPAQLSSVLFMARLCQSMSELCPNLKDCILGKHRASEPALKSAPRQSKKLGKSRAATEVSPAEAKWVGLKEDLLACSLEAYRIWSSTVSKVSNCCIYSILSNICCKLSQLCASYALTLVQSVEIKLLKKRKTRHLIMKFLWSSMSNLDLILQLL